MISLSDIRLRNVFKYTILRNVDMKSKLVSAAFLDKNRDMTSVMISLYIGTL